MSSIKSLVLVLLFGQMSLIAPILPVLAENGGVQSQQSQSQQPQVPVQDVLPPQPNYNLLRGLIKEHFLQTQQEDPRLLFLRDLMERLQMVENQESQAAAMTMRNSNDYNDVDLNEFLGNSLAAANKRSWDKMNGMWGKRAGNDNWNKFRGE